MQRNPNTLFKRHITHTHSLYRMLWTRLTSHDSMAPYFPVPWSLGTSLSAFAQTPSPDPHA